MSTYNLEKRVSYIAHSLNLPKEKVHELSMSAFCKEYGEQADRREWNKKEVDKIKKKYRNYGFSVLAYKWDEISDELSGKCGIYAIYGRNKNEDKCLLYIGKSTDLLHRIPSSLRALRINEYALVNGVKYLILENKSDMDLLELLYIQKYNPIYNRDCNRNSPSMFASLLDPYIDINQFKEVPR